MNATKPTENFRAMVTQKIQQEHSRILHPAGHYLDDVAGLPPALVTDLLALFREPDWVDDQVVQPVSYPPIRTALRAALKKGRKTGMACLGAWGRILGGVLRMARQVQTVAIGGVQIPVRCEFSSKIIADLCFGDYEAAEVRMVSEKITKDDVVLEFGGGLGLVSTLCAKRIGSERVFCYEANPAMIHVIKDTYRTNGVSPSLSHGLLGTADGMAELFVGAHFYSASAISFSSDAKKIQVPSFAINSVIHQVRPTFLIMDIEGGERDLVPAIDFSGIRKVLIELHPGRIGDEGVRRVRQCLTAAGLSVDTRLSEEKIIFLEKLV
jgi:FkbM family methyltransferase